MHARKPQYDVHRTRATLRRAQGSIGSAVPMGAIQQPETSTAEAGVRTSYLVGVGMVFLAAVAFSGKAIVAKLMYRTGEVDAVTVLALRMGFSLPFFALVGLREAKRATRPLTHKEKVAIVLLGLVGYYAASFLDFLGLELISAGLERLILFLYPTIVALLMAVRAKRWPSRRELLALLLSYGGIALVFVADVEIERGGRAALVGAALVFGSALTYAVYLVGNGEVAARVGMARFTAYAMLVSTGASVLQFLLTRPLGALDVSATVYAYGVMLALVCTVLPTFLTSAGIQRIGASTTAIVSSVGPVATIGLGATFLGETITGLELVGAALVLGGVLLVSAAKR